MKLVLIFAAVLATAAIIFAKRRDSYPGEGDAFAGDVPSVGDGMSV